MIGGTHLGWAESENGAAEKMDVHDASKLQIQQTTNHVTKGPKSHGQSIAFLLIKPLVAYIFDTIFHCSEPRVAYIFSLVT